MPLENGERQVTPDLGEIRQDHRARYEWAIRRLDQTAWESPPVLDLGCGIGYGSWLLARAGYRVLAADRDAETVAYAGEHYASPDITHVVMDLAQSPVSLEWGHVTCFEVIEHLAHPERFLSELARGDVTLYGSVPNESRFPFRGRYTHHMRHYTRDQLEALLDQSGWDLVSLHGQDSQTSEVEPWVGPDTPGRTWVFEARARTDWSYEPRPEPRPEDFALPGKPLPKSVAIIALGSSKRDYLAEAARLGDPHLVADEIWTINAAGPVLRCDRMFHMDDLRLQKARGEFHVASQISEMIRWYKNFDDCPIYTSVAYSEFPASVEYPLEFVLNQTDRCYFEGTPPYVFAFAMALGVERISLYGFDYSWRGNAHGESGQACLEYWISLAIERGIEVRIPRGSRLMGYDQENPKELYGYERQWVTIDRHDGFWQVGQEPRMDRDIPSVLEMSYRYSHDPEQERLEPLAKRARELEFQAADLAAATARSNEHGSGKLESLHERQEGDGEREPPT
jgi:SAM-dependent methyltransferase